MDLLLECLGIYLGCLPFVYALASGEDSSDFENARWEMVENQIMSRGVSDRAVIAAMLTVPRHLFVPERLRDKSYLDNPLPVGDDQTISQPYIVGLMTALLQPRPGKRVLEIGTGSGYQTAVLRKSGCEVYTVEIIPGLAKKARSLLENLGYEGISYRIGDGYEGWPEHAPYDGIIVTAAPGEVPGKLVEQLKEGGKMVIPVGSGLQELLLIEKTRGEITRKTITPVRFVPMTKG